jgi:hypothetical protein
MKGHRHCKLHVLFNILNHAFFINPIGTIHQFCTTSIVLPDLHDLYLAGQRFPYCNHELVHPTMIAPQTRTTVRMGP